MKRFAILVLMSFFALSAYADPSHYEIDADSYTCQVRTSSGVEAKLKLTRSLQVRNGRPADAPDQLFLNLREVSIPSVLNEVATRATLPNFNPVFSNGRYTDNEAFKSGAVYDVSGSPITKLPPLAEMATRPHFFAATMLANVSPKARPAVHDYVSIYLKGEILSSARTTKGTDIELILRYVDLQGIGRTPIGEPILTETTDLPVQNEVLRFSGSCR